MCSGSEAGMYLRLIDSVCHSTLGVRVMTKRRAELGYATTRVGCPKNKMRKGGGRESLGFMV